MVLFSSQIYFSLTGFKFSLTIICTFCFLTAPLKLVSQISFKKNEIYIVARSTIFKTKIIAEDFNLIDKKITHIGLGILENDSLTVYHISSEMNNDESSSLVSEGFNSFAYCNDVTYVSIWSSKLGKRSLSSLKRYISTLKQSFINFDNSFSLSLSNDDRSLYCSEFVYKALLETGKKKFLFKPVSKKLNDIYQKFLQRDTLEYIPVDFFQTLGFKKVYEKNIIIP